MNELFQYVVIGVASVVGGIAAVKLFWRVRSALALRRASERPLHSARAVLWRDPGDVAGLDLAAGPGGPGRAPQAPFRYLEEHFGGSRPCVSVRDARNQTWRIKWGDEVEVECLATRLAWAAGYFVETTYYVAEGTVEGTRDLKRAGSCLDSSGRFTSARFELEEADVITHFEEHSWSWADNPFVATRELNGLKVVMMWLSNWDAKDLRDVARGSNTAIYEYRTTSGEREARYLISDWGGALGRWGNVVNRGRWDSVGFTEQTPHFVQGVEGEYVKFGYAGQRTTDIAEGIRVTDVGWLIQYLGRVTAAQIKAAVRASGGTDEDAERFTRALLDRIAQLRQVAIIAPAAPRPDIPSAAAS